MATVLVKKFDKILQKYYQTFDVPYQQKFVTWANENGFEDDNFKSEIESGAQDCMMVDFDPHFPLEIPVDDITQRNIQIYSVLKFIYENNTIPPVSKYKTFNSINFNIDKKTLKQSNKLHKTQLPCLVDINEKDLMKAFALSSVNNFPVLTYIVDAYTRDNVKLYEKHKKTINESKWCVQNAAMKALKQTNSTTHQFILNAMYSYCNRMLPRLQLQPIYKVDDNIKDITKYLVEVSKFIQRLIKFNAVQPPFQIDLLFGVRSKSAINIVANDDAASDVTDDDDDGDPNPAVFDDDDDPSIDQLGQITDKLKAANCKYWPINIKKSEIPLYLHHPDIYTHGSTITKGIKFQMNNLLYEPISNINKQYIKCKLIQFDHNDFPLIIYLHKDQLKSVNIIIIHGTKFKMGSLYYRSRGNTINNNYIQCQQITRINDNFPHQIYLHQNQLKSVDIMKENSKGIQFKTGNIAYKTPSFDDIDIDMDYVKCQQFQTKINNDFPSKIYLDQNQFKYVDIIKDPDNITTRVNHQQIKPSHQPININNNEQKQDNTSSKLGRIIYNRWWKFRTHLSSKNPHKSMSSFPHKKRFCIFVDRRQQTLNEKDKMIFFEALPSSNSMPNGKYVNEWYFQSVIDSLIPNNVNNIGAKQSVNGQLMTFSFHVEQADEIKCYIMYNGQTMRFHGDYITKVLPSLFDDNLINEEFIKDSKTKQIQDDFDKQISDPKFDAFYESLQ